MKRNIFQYSLKTLFCLIILITTLTLPAQEWQWAYHAGNDIGEDKIMEIVTDDQGNCYVLYHYAAESNPMLDNQPIEFPEHYGNDKAFLLLASYDCHGEMRWYKTIYNTYKQSAQSVLYWHDYMFSLCFLKIRDNQLLLGVQGNREQIRVGSPDGTDTLILGNELVYNSTDWILGLDTDGNIMWHNSLKGAIHHPEVPDDNAYYCNLLSADIDDEGNIHVLYKISENGYSISPAFPFISGCQMYVLKFSPAGEHLLTTPLTLSGFPMTYNSLCWINHKYYITSLLSVGDVVINEDTLYDIHYSPGILICYGEDGEFGFYRMLSDTTKTYNMQRDEDGHLYFSYGGREVYDVPLPDIFKIPVAVKYDTLGNVLSYKYVESYGGCENIAQLSDSTFAMVGWVSGETDFDGVFSDEGCVRPFVAVVNENNGRFLHAATAPTSDGQSGDNGINAVAADPDGNLIVGGYFRAQEIQVGDSLFTNQWSGYFDMFVARYGWTCGEPADWPSLGTGIAEHETPGESNSPLRPYPNPATDHFDIDASLLKEGTEVSLYDMSGRLVRTSVVTGGSAHFNISDLVPGVYLLKAGDAVGKVVKHP